MPVRIMSDAELTKFEILRDVDHERMPVRAAAQVLGLTERQVWRLLKAYRLRGADGLISRKRGRPSNRKTSDDVRLTAMALVRERYADFGPTLAAEKLGELHDLRVSRETLRAWMVADGLWQTARSVAARFTNLATGATASASWCRSTAPSTAGSRIAAPSAPCWCSSTTPPVG